MAAMPPARPCPPDDVTSRQDISTPFSILIEFEATEYSYSIRYSIRIQNFKNIRFDIRFEWNSRFVPSLMSEHDEQGGFSSMQQHHEDA